MIEIGVYGVGWRSSARSNVSLCMRAMLQAAVEKVSNRDRVARVHVDVVVAETLERLALDRPAPQPRQPLGMVFRNQRVGIPHEDEQRHAQLGRMRTRIEDTAHEDRYPHPRLDSLGAVNVRV